ncbi:diguanylate cyclase domain-containing protein [Nodosilinea sp. E11]|uniref:diguanylate cyclase domain-containing protein n=1 Tax=Nodosilinea sp. E11 TaxID=3037479 RepID=UPI0029344864|nr:diguanylate cyclase [Nodosilinea sp. E11]WOD41083.1 diguanylate cyclase [Nodosilinea sp. E11]
MAALRQATILVVDSAPHFTHGLTQTLTQVGYQVQVQIETDLLPLLSAPLAKLPNLIILPVAGADSEGYRLCRQLKSAPATAAIPVILAGEFADADSRLAVFAAGGADYIELPGVAADIVSRVHHHIEISALAPTANLSPSRPSLLQASLQRLHNSLDLDTILSTAVHDVQQQTQADRVVIYQFQSNGRGVVTHEAIADAELSILHRQIEDHCFDQEHAIQYWSGRVGQINDVANLGDVSRCYRDMLLSFAIRANLVVPIIHNLIGETRYLWGLVILHQCHQPRQWQQDEIDLLQELSAHLAIAIQQSRLFEQVRRQIRQEQLLNHILDDMRASLEVQAILTGTVERLCSALNLSQCGITLLDHTLANLPSPFVVSAQAPNLVTPALPLKITETLRQQLREASNATVAAPAAATPFWLHQAQLISQGQTTYVATIIRTEGQVQGLLWLCPSPAQLVSSLDTLSPPEFSDLHLVEEVAIQLSQVLQQAALYQRLQTANDELQRLAHLDGLTQIANRREFDRYLFQEWQRLQREQGSLALVLADVDYFKGYNDTYGHLAGDDCLRSLGQLFTQVTKRPADLAVRYGGEEFALILPNTTTAGAIALIAEVRAHLARLALPNRASPLYGQLTLSFGITAIVPTPRLSLEQLIKRADQALYAAKQNGRNRYCLWSKAIESEATESAQESLREA